MANGKQNQREYVEHEGIWSNATQILLNHENGKMAFAQRSWKSQEVPAQTQATNGKLLFNVAKAKKVSSFLEKKMCKEVIGKSGDFDWNETFSLFFSVYFVRLLLMFPRKSERERTSRQCDAMKNAMEKYKMSMWSDTFVLTVWVFVTAWKCHATQNGQTKSHYPRPTDRQKMKSKQKLSFRSFVDVFDEQRRTDRRAKLEKTNDSKPRLTTSIFHFTQNSHRIGIIEFIDSDFMPRQRIKNNKLKSQERSEE